MCPKLTTYLEGKESLKLAINLGFDKLLVEESNFSLLCRSELKNNIDFDRIKSLFELGKKLNPQIEIIFNLDLIPHNQDLEKISNLISQLKKIGYDGIRIQDIGLVSMIYQKAPEMIIEINTITGNNNKQALSFLEKNLKPVLRTIVLSKEISYNDLLKISQESLLQNEILVHGPILLFYSKRRLIHENRFKSQAKIEKDHYTFFLQENKRPDESFFFYDNQHGTFMLHSQELCLIKQIPNIIELKIPYFLFDFRGKSPNVMENVTRAFKRRLAFLQDLTEQDSFIDNDLKIIKSHYPQGITEGFFLENLTDSHVRIKEKTKSTCVAKVVGVIKEKVIAVETYSPFTNQDTLTVKTPEKKSFLFTPLFIENLEGDHILSPEPGKIVLLNWKKGFTPESLLYSSNAK